jgi:hypothetical protein
MIPNAGWNSWLQAAIAAERDFQREVAMVVAHLQRQFDAELKELRTELEAKIALSAADASAEQAMARAQLSVEVLAVKAELLNRMTETISQMRKVLAAAEPRAAEPPKSPELSVRAYAYTQTTLAK